MRLSPLACEGSEVRPASADRLARGGSVPAASWALPVLFLWIAQVFWLSRIKILESLQQFPCSRGEKKTWFSHALSLKAVCIKQMIKEDFNSHSNIKARAFPCLLSAFRDHAGFVAVGGLSLSARISALTVTACHKTWSRTRFCGGTSRGGRTLTRAASAFPESRPAWLSCLWTETAGLSSFLTSIRFLYLGYANVKWTKLYAWELFLNMRLILSVSLNFLENLLIKIKFGEVILTVFLL